MMTSTNDTLQFTTTTYRTAAGQRYEAVHISWGELDRALGYRHDGSSEADRAAVVALLRAGAPEWVKDAEGWTDEAGWGLVGPRSEPDDAEVAEIETEARSDAAQFVDEFHEAFEPNLSDWDWTGFTAAAWSDGLAEAIKASDTFRDAAFKVYQDELVRVTQRLVDEAE